MKYFFMIFALMFGMTLTANASNIGNKGIQVREFVYDFAVDGGSVGFKDLSTKLNNALPAGSSILRMHTYVQTALTSDNSGGSATVGVGDYDSNARYLSATAYDNSRWADENLAALSTALPNQVASAAEGKVGVVIGTAALTAGKISIIVEFVQAKR